MSSKQVSATGEVGVLLTAQTGTLEGLGRMPER